MLPNDLLPLPDILAAAAGARRERRRRRGARAGAAGCPGRSSAACGVRWLARSLERRVVVPRAPPVGQAEGPEWDRRQGVLSLPGTQPRGGRVTHEMCRKAGMTTGRWRAAFGSAACCPASCGAGNQPGLHANSHPAVVPNAMEVTGCSLGSANLTGAGRALSSQALGFLPRRQRASIRTYAKGKKKPVSDWPDCSMHVVELPPPPLWPPPPLPAGCLLRCLHGPASHASRLSAALTPAAAPQLTAGVWYWPCPPAWAG